MLEMSAEIDNGQKLTFRGGISALSFAVGFGCVNDAF